MRASIYTRISRDREGAGLGVRTQEDDCRQLAASLGATVVSVHSDNDLSAYSGKPRPGYNALIGEIGRGETDAVLAWHTDRLHRSPAELEDYITLCETAGVRTITVKAGNIDLSSPGGLMMARTYGNFARYEVDHARERMQRAKERSASAGKWKGGRRPFGYAADGVTIQASEAALIADAADRVIAGESMRGIARAWEAAGSTTTAGRPWNPTGVRRTLLRPRNAGLMEHQGEIVGEAEWAPIIEREKWEAVRRILTDPSRRTNNTNSAVRWLGSGIYQCGGCGSVVRSARDRQGRAVYRCRERGGGEHVSRRAQEVDEYISELVVRRLRDPDAREILRKRVGEVDVKLLEKQAVELETRKNQLADLFTEGAIDRTQLAQGTRKLKDQLSDLREQIAGVYAGTALDGIGGAPDPGQAWLEANLDRQRLVLDALMSVTLDKAPRGRPAGWEAGESYFRPGSVRIEWRSR